MAKNNFILFAEDDEDDQELIRLVFSKVTNRHAFEIVANGQEVLDRLAVQNKLPCLIILDLNMPVLNGMQTLAALENQSRFAKIPKVILTTSENEDNKKRSYSLGAIDYFIKPSSMKDFIKTAERILSYCD